LFYSPFSGNSKWTREGERESGWESSGSYRGKQKSVVVGMSGFLMLRDSQVGIERVVFIGILIFL